MDKALDVVKDMIEERLDWILQAGRDVLERDTGNSETVMKYLEASKKWRTEISVLALVREELARVEGTRNNSGND